MAFISNCFYSTKRCVWTRSRRQKTVENIFSSIYFWRNEIADLVWFPTGGDKEIFGDNCFVSGYRRFTNSERGIWNNRFSYVIHWGLLTLQLVSKSNYIEIPSVKIVFNTNSYSLGVSENYNWGFYCWFWLIANQWEEGTGNLTIQAWRELEKNSSLYWRGKIEVHKNIPGYLHGVATVIYW
jgi:hypothetical protein